jgi:hypothetical protein
MHSDTLDGLPRASAPSSWRGIALEAVAAFGTAALFTWRCSCIDVDPLERVGQVSGLAGVGFLFALFAIPLVAALVIAARVHGGAGFATTLRLVCASAAGLVSGVVAGGMVVLLSKTDLGLGGYIGDTGVLSDWADAIRRGDSAPGLYPPLQIHLLAWIGELRGGDSLHAIKAFQIFALVVIAPCSYLSWRLLLPPLGALAIGVTATIPMIEPYRLYPFIVLVMFVPVAIRFLQVLRHADRYQRGQLARYGVAFGVGLGLLFLLYSGWFQWSAPGFLFASLLVFPWRRGWRKGALLCAIAIALFAVVTTHYLLDVMHAPAIRDDYFYFDTSTDPIYVAMWRGDLPGNQPVWPPTGELGGVGVFTLILIAGLGASIALGRARTLVLGVTSMMVGAFLFRLWYARSMWHTKLVQLYPRTTAEILYCLVILCGFAAYLAIQRARARAPEDSPLRSPSGTIGLVVALLFLFVSTGSATVDRYMPKDAPRDLKWLGWMAYDTGALTENQAHGAVISSSSSIEKDPWSRTNLTDETPAAFSSELGHPEDHVEWIELKLPVPRRFSKVVLEPADGGFPIDFTIDVWDGTRWLTRVSRTNMVSPTGAQTFTWGGFDRTDKIRLRATKLAQIGTDHVLRLAEIQVLR